MKHVGISLHPPARNLCHGTGFYLLLVVGQQVGKLSHVDDKFIAVPILFQFFQPKPHPSPTCCTCFDQGGPSSEPICKLEEGERERRQGLKGPHEVQKDDDLRKASRRLLKKPGRCRIIQRQGSNQLHTFPNGKVKQIWQHRFACTQSVTTTTAPESQTESSKAGPTPLNPSKTSQLSHGTVFQLC